MHIESESADVARIVAGMSKIVTENDGWLHPGLVVRHVGQAYSIGINANDLERSPGLPLVQIPRALLIPVEGIEWEVRDGTLAAMSGVSGLSATQRGLLDLMLGLYGLAGKLEQACRTLPVLALQGQEHLLGLLRQGRKHWTGSPMPPASALVGTRTLACASGPEGGPSRPAKVLMPLIDLLNHHPEGAPFAVSDEGVSVAVRAKGVDLECFGYYGFRDALSLLLNYGYASSQPRFLQSIACRISIGELGHLQVQRQDFIPPRDLPRIERTADGVAISHINIFADNHRHAEERLALAIRLLWPEATPAAVQVAAQAASEQVNALNMAYYLALSDAVAASSGAGEAMVGMLETVVDHQLKLLQLARQRG